MTFADTDNSLDDFSDALIARRRHPTIDDSEDIYAGLLGTWDVTAHDYLEDGRKLVARGEWIFARTLDGRAVQDTLIVPGPDKQRSADHPRQRFGTSIRTLDPKQRRWQVTWLNPVSGRFDVLYARLDDGAIVQEGTNPAGLIMNWTFDKVSETEFHWIGKSRAGDGEWRVDTEFFGSRRT